MAAAAGTAFGRGEPGDAGSAAESRALAFLAREVPRWQSENHCFSCHNNGDAARALYMARRLSRAVDPQALRETSAWLARPGEWRNNGGDPRAADHRLAAIQFASALAAASDAGPLEAGKKTAPPDDTPLVAAGQLLVKFQRPDGSWQVDDAGQLGSPATYGTPLATWSARQVLVKAGGLRFRESIAKADRWLSNLRPRSVLDAGVALMYLESQGPPSADQQRMLIDLLIEWQTARGGWGPYRGSPPQVFDTAIALVALSGFENDAARQAVASGRQWLLDQQLEEGSWPETTRPAGSQSYAQRISTTAWATIALLATAKNEKNDGPVR